MKPKTYHIYSQKYGNNFDISGTGLGNLTNQENSYKYDITQSAKIVKTKARNILNDFDRIRVEIVRFHITIYRKILKRTSKHNIWRFLVFICGNFYNF